MEKIESLEELKYYLKNSEIITSNGNDSFYLHNGYIVRKFNGSIFKLKPSDFFDLYKESDFYLKEGEQESVDLLKDEDYYGRLQKRN